MTIYEALKARLNREPTNAELKADVKRILSDGTVEMAESRGQRRPLLADTKPPARTKAADRFYKTVHGEPR